METSIAMFSLIFGGVLERYPNIRVWTVHVGGYVPLQYGRSAHGHCWRDEPRAVISRSPTDYLGAFKFDVITHSQPALNSSMRLFSTEVLPALRVPVAVSPA
jgi:aminocarboxymuconate-semialdehyde decarboxylase